MNPPVINLGPVKNNTQCIACGKNQSRPRRPAKTRQQAGGDNRITNSPPAIIL